MVIEYQRAKLTVCPSQHAEHNELRNHTLNIKACLEGKGCLQTFTPSLCSRPCIGARQVGRPHFNGTASSDVLDATACGGGGGGGDGDGGIALSLVACSTLWRDPETRGAVPRAGLRRHAFAVRLAGLLLSCNKKTPPNKSCPKIARLGPPQAKEEEEANDKRTAGRGTN